MRWRDGTGRQKALYTALVSLYVIGQSWSAEGARVTLPWLAHLLALGAASVEVVSRAIKIQFGAAAMHVEDLIRELMTGRSRASTRRTTSRAGAM